MKKSLLLVVLIGLISFSGGLFLSPFSSTSHLPLESAIAPAMEYRTNEQEAKALHAKTILSVMEFGTLRIGDPAPSNYKPGKDI